METEAPEHLFLSTQTARYVCVGAGKGQTKGTETAVQQGTLRGTALTAQRASVGSSQDVSGCATSTDCHEMCPIHSAWLDGLTPRDVLRGGTVLRGPADHRDRSNKWQLGGATTDKGSSGGEGRREGGKEGGRERRREGAAADGRSRTTTMRRRPGEQRGRSCKVNTVWIRTAKT